MPNHKFTLEIFRNDVWQPVKSGLSATLACLGAALASLKGPGEMWRVARDDGEIFYP